MTRPPHIISNTEDSNFITEQFQKKLGNLKNKPSQTPEG